MPDRFAVTHRVEIPPEQQLREQLRLGRNFLYRSAGMPRGQERRAILTLHAS